MSSSVDFDFLPHESCSFTDKFEKKFSKLKPKQAKNKAELVNGINKLAEAVLHQTRNHLNISDHRNIEDIKGVDGVFEFKRRGTNNLRIYFTMRGSRPLIVHYGKRTNKEKDIKWVKNNLPPLSKD